MHHQRGEREALPSENLFMSLYLVNYRGSTGFGQDSILSLISHIGSQDVKDVQVEGFQHFFGQSFINSSLCNGK